MSNSLLESMIVCSDVYCPVDNQFIIPGACAYLEGADLRRLHLMPVKPI